MTACIAFLLVSVAGVCAQSIVACSTECRPNFCDTSTNICYSCSSQYVFTPSGTCGTSCPSGQSVGRPCSDNRTFCGTICQSGGTQAPGATSSGGSGRTQPAAMTTTSGVPAATKASGLSGAAVGGIIGASVGVLIIIGGAFIMYYFYSKRELALAKASTHVNMRTLGQAPSNSNLRSPAARGAGRATVGAIQEEETESSATPSAPPAMSKEQEAAGGDTAPLTPTGDGKAASPPAAMQVTYSDEQVQTFFDKLDEIRPNAATLLEIMNATNKVRRGTSDKEETVKMKLAMDDMGTVLRMANRKPSKVVIPPNGLQLVMWAAGLIASFKRSHRTSMIEEEEGV